LKTTTAFLGRAALEAGLGKPLTKSLVTFTVDDPAAVLVGRETILRDGQAVGYLTSGGYGYSIGKSIGLGYIRRDSGVTEPWLKAGRYALVIAGEETPAKLSLEPLIDPDGARIKA
jgi:sarcosine dehydrogenase